MKKNKKTKKIQTKEVKEDDANILKIKFNGTSLVFKIILS